MDDGYGIGAWITGTLTFFGVWIYCSVQYGFLGFALGWMPAAILGVIFGIFWPFIAGLLALGIGIAIVALLFMARK